MVDPVAAWLRFMTMSSAHHRMLAREGLHMPPLFATLIEDAPPLACGARVRLISADRTGNRVKIVDAADGPRKAVFVRMDQMVNYGADG